MSSGIGSPQQTASRRWHWIVATSGSTAIGSRISRHRRVFLGHVIPPRVRRPCGRHRRDPYRSPSAAVWNWRSRCIGVRLAWRCRISRRAMIAPTRPRRDDLAFALCEEPRLRSTSAAAQRSRSCALACWSSPMTCTPSYVSASCLGFGGLGVICASSASMCLMAEDCLPCVRPCRRPRSSSLGVIGIRRHVRIVDPCHVGEGSPRCRPPPRRLRGSQRLMGSVGGRRPRHSPPS